MRALKTIISPVEASPGTGPASSLLASLLRGFVREQVFRLPLFLPVALALGAGAYMTAPVEPPWEVLGVIFGAALVVWLIARRTGSMISLVFALAACAAGGAVTAKFRTLSVEAPVLIEQIGPVQIEGVIVELDASDRNRRVRIAVRAIEGVTHERTPYHVRFSYRGDLGFSPGRAVTCRAILSPPPRPVVPGDYVFHRDAWFAQLGGVGFSTGGCRPLPMPPAATAVDDVMLWIAAVRRMLAEHVSEAAGEAGGGMAAAMVAGDRSFIHPDDSEALRASGLAHLLAISGLHMAMVGGAVFFFVRILWPLAEPLALRMPSVKVAAAIAIIACALYFTISGWSVATQRAFIMALIAFGAKLFDKPAISLRSLAVAMTIVVMLQPEAVVTPGFQMSFAATGALITLYELWPKLNGPGKSGLLGRFAPWLVGAALTSLFASIATMPFAMHHFDRAAVMSVVANIAATPIMSLWTAPSAVAAAVTAPLGIQDFFLASMGMSLEAILWIAHTVTSISPEPDLPQLPAAGVVWSAIALALFCILAGYAKWLALPPCLIAIAVWSYAPRAVGYAADDGTVFLKSTAGWYELTDWRQRNGLNPLLVRGAIEKPPCDGKGAPCLLVLPSGRFEIRPVVMTRVRTDETYGESLATALTDCPAESDLIFSPGNGSTDLTVRPCELARRGGAVIELSGSGRTLRIANRKQLRPWDRAQAAISGD